MDIATSIELIRINTLDDDDHTKFPLAFKVRALTDAQNALSAHIRPELLTELEVIKTSLTVTAGVTAVLTTANLGFDPLNGGDGILAALATVDGSDKWLTRTTKSQSRAHYFSATTYDPYFYVYENKIYVLPIAGIGSIDVYMLRVPEAIIYNLTASGGSATTVTSTDTDLDLSGNAGQVSNYYKGTIIWNIDDNVHYKVNAHAYSDPTHTFTIDDVGAKAQLENGENFAILTNDFDAFVGAGIQSQLNPSFHLMQVALAEAACWAMDGKPERAKMAKDTQLEEVKLMNEMFTAPVGIGTSEQRRAIEG